MRYHWGLGIGHTYSHGQDIFSHQHSTPFSRSVEIEDPEDQIINKSEEELEILQSNHRSPRATTDFNKNHERNLGSEPEDKEDEEADSCDDCSDLDGDSSADTSSDVDSHSDSTDEEMMELRDTYK